jgi:hypothetical protein
MTRLQKSFAALEEDNPRCSRNFFPTGRTEFSSGLAQESGYVVRPLRKILTDHKADALPAGPTCSRMPRFWPKVRPASGKPPAKAGENDPSPPSTPTKYNLLVELFGAYTACCPTTNQNAQARQTTTSTSRYCPTASLPRYRGQVDGWGWGGIGRWTSNRPSCFAMPLNQQIPMFFQDAP